MKSRAIKRLPLAFAMVIALTAVMASSASATAIVSTGAAHGITGTEERLEGTVEETNGVGTTYTFEYGPTTAYGSSTPAGEVKPNTKGPVSVSANIKGLQRTTEYHYRLVALEWTEGPGEIAYGKDATFTTVPGLYLTGEKSGEESKQPKFVSTSYPDNLLATVYPETNFTFFFPAPEGTPRLECSVMYLTGSLSAASSTIQLNPVLSETIWKCAKIFGANVKIKTHGCYYTYNLANSGPPYTGGVAIGCKEASERIEIEINPGNPLCTVKIPPQTPESSVSYRETSTAGYSALEVNAATTGPTLAYEKVGPFCNLINGNGGGGFSGKLLLY